MVSHPSGLANEIELIEIETESFSLYIKGRPFHHRYESLKQYKDIHPNERMYFSVIGGGVESIRLFDVNEETLTESQVVPPLFFENGVYQLVVTPKNKASLEFYHEHPSIRKAVSKVGKPPNQLLMGNLTFTNEVGYSTFSIYSNGDKQLEITLEIFPSKLSYKEDYKKLLEEVNEEIYNLAYHFVKKTYLGSTTTLTVESSWTEFYRLLMKYYKQFSKSISQIERQPHHQLSKEHQLVRGDQLKKQDSKGRKFLQKRPDLFVKTEHGINIADTSLMPIKGLNVKKFMTYDTLENRFVKWMMIRLSHKIDMLKKVLEDRTNLYYSNNYEEVVKQLNGMEKSLNSRLKSTFWKGIGTLDRSVMSLVMQLAPGYREAYQTYLTLSRGLVLNGELAKMSIKDVATLYEYWTFLKLGQILAAKYIMVSQDIIKVNRNGLFVTLDQSMTAKRIFRHPHTNEKITLYFQKHSGRLPTVKQKPDSVLSIEKVGKDYSYEYVFDAKYRVDFAIEGSYYERNYNSPGPLEEDINTMHRYRDAIVSNKVKNYERTTFGAYVLFPWGEELEYEKHEFYQSIQKVNIGGFPFLPNATSLVERFLDRLIESSPKKLQQEGILPKGTLQEWQSSLEEKVLIIKVNSKQELIEINQTGEINIASKVLCKDWNAASYISLYMPKNVFGEDGGINQFAKVNEVCVNESYLTFKVHSWKRLKTKIKPVGYGISSSSITSLNNLKTADELPKLYMKSSVEKQLWNVIRRFSKDISVGLDKSNIEQASQIVSLSDIKKGLEIKMNKEYVIVTSPNDHIILSYEDCLYRVNKVFKSITAIL
ncbi:DUF2357 domain-containing protein [Thalassobacillus hwangdonensis]|uniref:DUF2357 domain-containing protein n=1 Tax=Thalassobacillus hwangdonensis TaxID=546108 RepID=A0ABW3L652_9BACI